MVLRIQIGLENDAALRIIIALHANISPDGKRIAVRIAEGFTDHFLICVESLLEISIALAVQDQVAILIIIQLGNNISGTVISADAVRCPFPFKRLTIFIEITGFQGIAPFIPDILSRGKSIFLYNRRSGLVKIGFFQQGSVFIINILYR